MESLFRIGREYRADLDRKRLERSFDSRLECTFRPAIDCSESHLQSLFRPSAVISLGEISSLYNTRGSHSRIFQAQRFSADMVGKSLFEMSKSIQVEKQESVERHNAEREEQERKDCTFCPEIERLPAYFPKRDKREVVPDRCLTICRHFGG